MEEMVIAESNMAARNKLDLKLISKQEQMKFIKNCLTNFKNEKFKTKVAEFLSWLNFVLNPVEAFGFKFPSDLKANLTKLERYDGDIQMLAEDVNNKFKYTWNAPNKPAPQTFWAYDMMINISDYA